MKMSDRFNLPMKVDGYSVESTPMRHHTYPCEVVSDIECDSGEDAMAVAHAINNHDALVEAMTAMKKDLLNRAEIDSDGCKVVACGSSVWERFKEALENAKGES